MLQRLERDMGRPPACRKHKGAGLLHHDLLPGTHNSECKITDTPGASTCDKNAIILPQEEKRPNIWSSSTGDHQVPFQGSAWLCRQTQASAGTTLKLSQLSQ